MFRVLVVDDDYDIRFIVSYLLERQGFKVEKADGAKQAFEKLNLFKPQVVLLDICLGLDDGRELCQHLKAVSKSPIRIILYSALVDNIKPTEHCADDFIPKPFDTKELVKIIREHAQLVNTLALATLTCFF